MASEIDHELKRLYENKTPTNILIQVMAHNDHVAHCYIGVLVLDYEGGLYKVKVPNGEFTFTCLECHFENDCLIVTYDIGYKRHFTNFSHSSMA